MCPINDDQLQLVERLKQVKWRMQNTSVMISGETLTIWKLADVQDNLDNPALSSRFDGNTVIQFVSQGAELHKKLDKLNFSVTSV